MPNVTTSPLVKLTETAIQKIKYFSEVTPNAREKFFRVRVKTGGCNGLEYKFDFDQKKETDLVCQYEGLEVLVDPQSKDYLQGSTIDYIEDLQRSGFRVKNPNATHSCKCGNSFSVSG